MNTTLFESKKNEYAISDPGYDTITKKEMNWRNKITKEIEFTIPAGSRVHVDFSEKFTGNIFTTYNGRTARSLTRLASNWLKGFHKAPTLRQLEKWTEDGVCQTPLGNRTEPDGYGPCGEPSWLLVESLI